MKTIYIAWQDTIAQCWLPVGQLTFTAEKAPGELALGFKPRAGGGDAKRSHSLTGGVYRFVYTKGALKSKSFLPFGRMDDLKSVYESIDLFPLFSNRLLSKTRPEYKDFLHWLDIRENEDDPLALLALTEGKRETDNLEVFPRPERTIEGKYLMKFFSHRIGNLPTQAVQMINKLHTGDQLLLMPDPQNPHDRYAIALRNNETTIVGYCPRYLTEDFHYLLKECAPKDINIQVERVNSDAPIQLRLLCQITAPWQKKFKPCSGKNYQRVIKVNSKSTASN